MDGNGAALDGQQYVYRDRSCAFRLRLCVLPEEKIRSELRAGTLKTLPVEGSERYAELYLVFADREHAGPGAQRLAEIIREMTATECTRHQKAGGTPKRGVSAKRANKTAR